GTYTICISLPPIDHLYEYGGHQIIIRVFYIIYRALRKSSVVISRCIKGMFALQGSAHSIRMRTLG
ncbi:hypothetical protein BDR03DRAFT_961989, partial [Suillus americanus]